eukprot:1976539-Amphidinium_carterae.1
MDITHLPEAACEITAVARSKTGNTLHIHCGSRCENKRASRMHYMSNMRTVTYDVLCESARTCAEFDFLAAARQLLAVLEAVDQRPQLLDPDSPFLQAAVPEPGALSDCPHTMRSSQGLCCPRGILLLLQVTRSKCQVDRRSISNPPCHVRPDGSQFKSQLLFMSLLGLVGMQTRHYWQKESPSPRLDECSILGNIVGFG